MSFQGTASLAWADPGTLQFHFRIDAQTDQKPPDMDRPQAHPQKRYISLCFAASPPPDLLPFRFDPRVRQAPELSWKLGA